MKKWIIAKETGRGGYEHWQVRCKVSREDFFDYVKKHAHFITVLEAQDEWIYERKEHQFTSSEDTKEILKIRYGVLRKNQIKILKAIEKQGDRNVTVVYDHSGNHGKTFLVLYLYEHGRALVVPRASTTGEKLSAYICSAYNGEEIICIDIPRSRPITAELYEAVEEIKDGLVFDHRYSGRCRNIRGAKVIITTNSKLEINKLSQDRWHAIDYNGNELDLNAVAVTTKKKTTKT